MAAALRIEHDVAVVNPEMLPARLAKDSRALPVAADREGKKIQLGLLPGYRKCSMEVLPIDAPIAAWRRGLSAKNQP